jgi:Ski2 N-terminal region
LTSTSLDRPPGPNKNFVRGKSGYVPFWPGGLDDILLHLGSESSTRDYKKGLRTIPPGFNRGLRLPGDEIEDHGLLSLDELPLENPKETVCLSCDRWYYANLISYLFSMRLTHYHQLTFLNELRYRWDQRQKLTIYYQQRWENDVAKIHHLTDLEIDL